MPEEIRVITALLFSLAGVLAFTPMAIRVARRTNFYDEPTGYKTHAVPTPYLGGAAVISTFVLTAVLLADGSSRFAAVALGAIVLWLIGTVDDYRTVRPSLRILAAAGAGGLLWASGLGWSVFQDENLNLVLTLLWVIGLVNAFNLMDNMDGAAATLAAVSGCGVAVLALANNDPGLAALAFALVGACIGFLKFNLALPARVFLGDGGSMPIGFILAAAVIALPERTQGPLPVLLSAALLLGLPIFDTALVIVSRIRRGVTIWSGGRDHVTHRLHSKRLSTRAVVAILGFTQAALCAVAIVAVDLENMTSTPLAAIFVTVAIATLCLLEMEGWAPAPRPRNARIANPAAVEDASLIRVD